VITHSPTKIIPAETQGLPHSREAEEAVLGAVLIDPEKYFEVSQIVRPEDFYIVRNRWIWEAIIRLEEHRIPVDYLTVSEELEKQNQMAEIGGAAYLMSLINQTPTSLNAESYAEVVEQYSIRRRMLSSANQLAQLAYNQQQSVETIVDEAEKAVFGLSEDRIHHDVQPIKAVLGEYTTRMDELARRSGEIFGVPTGLYDLDKLLGGMQKSDLLIIAGRPVPADRLFAFGCQNAAQKHKKHVAIFSLEMSNEQLVQRLIAQETGIDTQRLRTGKLEDDEWDKFMHSIQVLEDTHIFLDDTPALTPLQLRTKCRRLHMEYQLDLIIVDYIQLMASETRSENRVQEVSYISRNLKVLARELNVPVLAAAQLSRAVEQRADGRPMLSDLRESGSLEQDADVVIFITRPHMLDVDLTKRNIAELIVAKHRNGPTSPRIELFFNSNLARFENALSLVDSKPDKGGK